MWSLNYARQSSKNLVLKANECQPGAPEPKFPILREASSSLLAYEGTQRARLDRKHQERKTTMHAETGLFSGIMISPSLR